MTREKNDRVRTRARATNPAVCYLPCVRTSTAPRILHPKEYMEYTCYPHVSLAPPTAAPAAPAVTRPASRLSLTTRPHVLTRTRPRAIGRTSLLYVPSRPAHRRHAMRATCVANHDLSTSSSFAGTRTRRGASYGRQIRSSARFVCAPRCGDVSAARGVLSPSLARAATGALAML